jgi:hypothetical protein
MTKAVIPEDQVRFFSGSSNPALAANIANELGVPLDATHISRFSNDNLYLQLGATVRYRRVYIVQSLSQPVNDHLMELLMMLDIARSAAASEVHAIIPYYSFARSDKKDAPRISITARLVADIQYLNCLVLTALHRMDYPLASQRIIACYHLAGKLGEKISACGLFIGLAAVAAGMNQPEHAARLSGMAQVVLETIHFRYEPIDHVEFDRHIQIARDQLGDVRFEGLASEGRTMPMEQSIAYALELSTSL